LIEGEIKAGDQVVSKRDGLGLTETNRVGISASKNADVLAIEIPMIF
jgi:hypothetical protein